ncbi:MAG TPA: glutathione S-transferase family protein [Steroidobacteraceae bacterium]|nr:glutathione S-transferase family protein [Steroidobacteraceae bacterium]
MTDLILHHFDLSPFAEKARVMFGIKGLEWSSVQIPMILPKPDLMPLTGGYRKTPVLQIGADVYCDTRRIALELERRFPEPTLFPAGGGLELALSGWSDRSFFEPGAGLSMGVNEELPKDLVDDRKAFFNFMDFSRLSDELPHLYGQFLCHAALVDRQLADGRQFVMADRPGLADVHAYFPLWMARTFVPPINALLERFPTLARWEARMAAIGHGRRQEIDAETALAIARAATPEAVEQVDESDPLGLAAGARVAVTPDDYGKVPVEGQLVALSLDEIAVRRDDPRVGEIVVHFPRIGYRVEALA